MLTTVAMRALDYDATEEMHVLMGAAMCNILGCDLEESQRRLLQQSGRALGLTQPTGPRGTCSRR